MLYDSKYIDFTKEPIFFGSGKNTQRFDVLKYKFFDNINAKMQGFDWTFDEINMSDDFQDMQTKVQEHEKFIYTKTLQKLIFLDSLQGRGILSTLGLIVTLPEIENSMLTWEYFEGSKHSKSYSHNIRNVYTNPSEVFDESFNIPELMELTNSIKEPYEDAYKKIIEYEYFNLFNKEYPEEKMIELKKSVIRLLVNINILEGVRFYPGFSAIWSMNKGQSLFEGTSKNLKLICRDENLHLAITQYILKTLKKEESEGFSNLMEEMYDEINDMYKKAYEEEAKWIDFIYSEGSVIGMNANIAKDYLKYIINRRLRAIGHKNIFENASTNPIPWVDEYIDYDKNEILPQEGEILNYISNGVDTSKGIDVNKYKTDIL